MAKLSPRDHDRVALWLTTKTPIVSVTRYEPRTLTDGKPNHTLLRYELLWTWSAERFGGHASTLQDRFWRRHGREGLIRRINRVRKACAAYGLHLEPLEV